MNVFEQHRGEFLISTDQRRLDIPVIYDFLANRSYWGKGRSLEMMREAIRNSLCFGLYSSGQQRGFARVVTDFATFGWLCDVFILEAYRGQGLGKWLVEAVVAHPALKDIRRIMLATNDAKELYRSYAGFTDLQDPERWMQRVQPYSQWKSRLTE